jgi:hypothetical protein
MSPLLEEVLKQVEQLTPEDRRELIRQVSQGLADQPGSKRLKHRLSEFRGIAPDLLQSKDAQEWVNELRDEWDEREQHLREGL